jgi:nitrite reductase (NO-forming)
LSLAKDTYPAPRESETKDDRRRLKLLGAALLVAAIAAGILLGTVRAGSTAPGREEVAAAARQARTNELASSLQARALAAAASRRAAFPAKLPPVQAGKVVRVTITVKDTTVEIAPGVRYRAWTFNGRVPGPVLHVRQGQRVEVTFRNAGNIPHSFDIHAARVPANRAFKDVAPGGSLRFSFVARDPGVFLYHCVTGPAVMHIANGMFGAIVVDPSRPLPRAKSEFVLVASEWYLDRSGSRAPAELDLEKSLAMNPDWMTFTGRASQYVGRPLHVRPHDLVRFYVVNAGPNLATPFHLVGTVFDRIYPDGDVAHPLTGIQTADVAPGGSGIFDARFDQAGLYGFVSHTFANADKGEVGDILVGNATGTMSH